MSEKSPSKQSRIGKVRAAITGALALTGIAATEPTLAQAQSREMTMEEIDAKLKQARADVDYAQRLNEKNGVPPVHIEPRKFTPQERADLDRRRAELDADIAAQKRAFDKAAAHLKDSPFIREIEKGVAKDAALLRALQEKPERLLREMKEGEPTS